eukprot:3079110-Amphidinium_carterae.1
MEGEISARLDRAVDNLAEAIEETHYLEVGGVESVWTLLFHSSSYTVDELHVTRLSRRLCSSPSHGYISGPRLWCWIYSTAPASPMLSACSGLKKDYLVSVTVHVAGETKRGIDELKQDCVTLPPRPRSCCVETWGSSRLCVFVAPESQRS